MTELSPEYHLAQQDGSVGDANYHRRRREEGACQRQRVCIARLMITADARVQYDVERALHAQSRARVRATSHTMSTQFRGHLPSAAANYPFPVALDVRVCDFLPSSTALMIAGD